MPLARILARMLALLALVRSQRSPLFPFRFRSFALRFLSLLPLLVCSPCSLSFARSARPFLLVACSCSSPLTSLLALLVLVRSPRSPLPLTVLLLLHLKHSISFTINFTLCLLIAIAHTLVRFLSLIPLLVCSLSSPLLICHLHSLVTPYASARPARSRSLAPLAPAPQCASPSSF